jgi:GT2 family glycosyltransferase
LWLLSKIWHLFEFTLENHVLWGEDYTFCRKYRQAGGKVWIDPDIMLHHTGKMTYTGRFIDTLSKLAPRHPEFIDPEIRGPKK